MTATFAAIPLLLALAGSPASIGTGIQAGPVCLPVTAQPGSSHTLPVTVQDTGSGTETIALHVQQASGTPGKPVPAQWVRFSAPVTLAPGATGTMTARLTVPPSAHGAYAAWIVAGPAGSGTPGQLSLGAEAIANLRFTVTRPGRPQRHVSCTTPHAQLTAGHASKHHPVSWSPTDPGNRIPLILACIGMFVTFLLVRRGGSS